MNVYRIITENIINEITASGELFWQKTWKMQAPANLLTKSHYHGINRFLLRDGDFWLTFNQANKAGLRIKKGAKSGIAVFYSPVVKAQETEEEDRKYFVLKYYNVFNSNHIEGAEKFIPESEPINPKEEERQIEEVLLNYIKKENVCLEYGGSHACYIPAEHKILIPQINNFVDYKEYLRTLAHEAGHSTGKALKRDMGNGDKESKKYMLEELIAEFTALFIAGQGKIKDNSTAYLQGWVSEFKEKPAMLVKAAGAAEKAARLIKGEQESDIKN